MNILKTSIMNKIVLLLSTLLIIGCSESRDLTMAKIPVEFNNSLNQLVNIVKSIDFIPLETDVEHLLGSSVDLNVTEDSYIVTDYLNGNIFRYSHDGRFLNNIGQRGNGPEEYVHINDVQYRDSTLYVFSVPSKIQRFSLSGSMLELRPLNELALGAMSWITDDGILTYYGYGSGRESRFSLLSKENKVDYFPSKEKVMNYTPSVQIFSESNDSVFVVDSYSDIIKVYSKGLMFDGPCFDFGKYAIPKSFYEYDDSFAAMDHLLGSEFAMVSQYLCEGNNRLAVIALQKQDVQSNYCGLYADGQWHWFKAGEVGRDVLANAFRQIKDGIIFSLLDPSLISTLPAALRNKATNPEVLETLGKDDNYVLAKLKFL